MIYIIRHYYAYNTAITKYVARNVASANEIAALMHDVTVDFPRVGARYHDSKNKTFIHENKPRLFNLIRSLY